MLSNGPERRSRFHSISIIMCRSQSADHRRVCCWLCFTGDDAGFDTTPAEGEWRLDLEQLVGEAFGGKIQDMCECRAVELDFQLLRANLAARDR